MDIQTIVQTAQDKKYSDFDKATRDILAQKVATKLADEGYFDRLNNAKGITESDKDDEDK